MCRHSSGLELDEAMMNRNIVNAVKLQKIGSEHDNTSFKSIIDIKILHLNVSSTDNCIHHFHCLEEHNEFAVVGITYTSLLENYLKNLNTNYTNKVNGDLMAISEWTKH